MFSTHFIWGVGWDGDEVGVGRVDLRGVHHGGTDQGPHAHEGHEHEDAGGRLHDALQDDGDHLRHESLEPLACTVYDVRRCS